jgi:hypothetical protein
MINNSGLYFVNVYLNEEAVSYEDLLNRRFFYNKEDAELYINSLPEGYVAFLIEPNIE